MKEKYIKMALLWWLYFNRTQSLFLSPRSHIYCNSTIKIKKFWSLLFTKFQNYVILLYTASALSSVRIEYRIPIPMVMGSNPLGRVWKEPSFVFQDKRGFRLLLKHINFVIRYKFLYSNEAEAVYLIFIKVSISIACSFGNG